MSRTLWVAFAIFIVYGTTMPFRFAADERMVQEKLARLSLNPFVSAETGRRVSLTDTAQNVMLFVPFGVLGAMALRTPVRHTAVRVALATSAGAALSVAVETAQLFTVDRVASISDVVTNTTGTLLGATVAEQARRWSHLALHRLVRAGVVEPMTFYPAMIATAVVAVAAWQPFDVTLDVSSVGRSVRALWRDPWQVGPFRDEGAAIIHYALFAVAICAWLTRLRVARPAMLAAAGCAAVGVMLEASQAIIDSRQPGGLDLAMRLAGVVVGLAVWHVARHSRRPGGWLALLLGATAVAVSLQMLSPFAVADRWRPFGWIPFVGYYQNNWFPSVSHLVELLLLYFPLGFCVGLATPDRRTAVLLIVFAVLLISVPVEYFQGWVVGRYPDITDVAVSFAGGWLGILASRDGARAFRETIATISGVERVPARRSA